MIKAIITDVDGVIVGDKTGINFPLPNEKVIQKLKEVNKKGIPVVLCTGKPKYAIEDIIIRAELDNPHITDLGAFIYNPLRNQVIKEHVINKNIAIEIVELCLRNNIYLDIFSTDEYFVQKDQVRELTNKRTIIMQKEPKLVDSLLEAVYANNIIKILAFAMDDGFKPQLEELLNPFNESTDMIWSTVPFMLPVMARVITAKNVSKMHAAEEVMQHLNISFDNCLGIGDLPPDWKFIKLCKYAGTVGNIDEKFIENIKTKGEGNYLLASSVDDDGFIEILNYFIK